MIISLYWRLYSRDLSIPLSVFLALVKGMGIPLLSRSPAPSFLLPNGVWSVTFVSCLFPKAPISRSRKHPVSKRALNYIEQQFLHSLSVMWSCEPFAAGWRECDLWTVGLVVLWTDGLLNRRSSELGESSDVSGVTSSYSPVLMLCIRSPWVVSSSWYQSVSPRLAGSCCNQSKNMRLLRPAEMTAVKKSRVWTLSQSLPDSLTFFWSILSGQTCPFTSTDWSSRCQEESSIDLNRDPRQSMTSAGVSVLLNKENRTIWGSTGKTRQGSVYSTII
jgi:hypothetical protein